MGLFKALADWNNERIEKHRVKMESQGKCPECHGTGFYMPPIVFDDISSENCPGCNGSGAYSDWESNQE